MPSKLPAILESQRQLGGTSYPPTVARLAELGGDTLTALGKALREKGVKERVLLTRSFKEEKAAADATLVLLAEDAGAIARSDRLLGAQLRSARKPGSPAVGQPQLCKGLARAVADAFKASLAERIQERRMPAGIAALPGGKPLFFFVEDALLPSGEAGDAPGLASAPIASANNGSQAFAERFDRAFTALDRSGGGHNYVTLSALRAALPDVSREAFDAELARLRIKRRYTLDPSDGRHRRMTEAEQEAGIMEAGNLLVYVARRSDT